MEEKRIGIKTEFIKLDSLLKFSGITGSGGEAKELIERGKVKVNREVCFCRGKKIRPGQTVEVSGKIEICVEEEKDEGFFPAT